MNAGMSIAIFSVLYARKDIRHAYNDFESSRKIKVPRTGIEPVTRGFSVLCSTEQELKSR